jgi:hypothetical protein
MMFTIIGRARMEKWKKVEEKFKFKLVKRKMERER